MKRVAVVTGANGQLGHALGAMAWPANWTVRALDRDALDIADEASVDRAVAHDCAVVINCAAYTAVDRAEDEVAAAWRANAEGPHVLAAACTARSIPLVHVSTDYVFDGTGTVPWKPDDPVAPLNVYGASKAAGELAVRGVARHAVVRTSWVVSTGRSFLRTMMNLAAQRAELRVVADQIGAPTGADDLAAALAMIATRLADDAHAPSGTYHFASRGETSWHGVAALILQRMEAYGRTIPALQAITSADFPTPARRPFNSRLALDAIGRDYDIQPPDWEDVVAGLVDAMLAQSDA